MLSCDQALELISARLDGPLSREESKELEEHLSACPACRALSDELALLHRELPTLAAQPPAGLKEGVMDQIDPLCQYVQSHGYGHCAGRLRERIFLPADAAAISVQYD